MQKWYKKNKKRIACLVSALCICIGTVLSGMDVSAESFFYRNNLSYAYTTPTLWSGVSYDESLVTNVETYSHIKEFNTNLTFSTDYYYRFIFTDGIVGLTNHTNNSASVSSSSRAFVQYGGEKYYFDNGYLSIIVPGHGYQTFSIGVETTLTTTSFFSGDFCYSNPLWCDVACSPLVRIFQMTPEEVSNYTGNALIVEKIEESNSWLEKIWNSIQQFFSGNDEDKTETEEFVSNSSTQADKLNGLNEQNKTDKPDIESTSSAVDEYIDADAIASYGTVLSSVTNNDYVVRMIMIVLSVGIIAYVLFGKR